MGCSRFDEFSEYRFLFSCTRKFLRDVACVSIQDADWLKAEAHGHRPACRFVDQDHRNAQLQSKSKSLRLPSVESPHEVLDPLVIVGCSHADKPELMDIDERQSGRRVSEFLVEPRVGGAPFQKGFAKDRYGPDGPERRIGDVSLTTTGNLRLQFGRGRPDPPRDHPRLDDTGRCAGHAAPARIRLGKAGPGGPPTRALACRLRTAGRRFRPRFTFTQSRLEQRLIQML